ncbi:dihydroxyacetone kinase phosphoryl donor subunit DhaM [Sanguibacter suaedae]|uniref:Phosphocarrier protein HPr n=1 Tax=Sanguibacter suaedae TaxID=2795737 RepID=A0A934I610_9MICO|nr:dihydroxyacetone kinase phosphoryl donor subunit DhaM [Sanguibacter suaedae]MBI9116254.1 PTS-dependent dihydroxyacetone kinase phosphotransferase subunit DhaM [Sanguibacter suaedae]
MTAPVGIVLVSHSQALAAGVVDLAAQMAPDVLIVPAAGTDDGGLGTGFDRVLAGVERALGECEEVLVLADLGSAVLMAESVLDALGEDRAARVRLADAPFVEGTVAAAVTAHGGAGLVEVLASAEAAGGTFARAGRGRAADGAPAGSGAPADGSGSTGAGHERGARRARLRNPLGLHARPAAVLARSVAAFDARVAIDGANAASVLELMKLGVVGGHEVEIRAEGPQAEEALDMVVAAIEGGFGEAPPLDARLQ